MSETLIVALAGIVGAVIGALIAQFSALRRAPAQARLDNAHAGREQQETSSGIIADLRNEIDRLKLRITELDTRILEFERRSVSSSELRQSVIFIGERLDRERREHQVITEKLCSIVEQLLNCFGSPDRIAAIDRKAIEELIMDIRNGVKR